MSLPASNPLHLNRLTVVVPRPPAALHGGTDRPTGDIRSQARLRRRGPARNPAFGHRLPNATALIKAVCMLGAIPDLTLLCILCYGPTSMKGSGH